MTGFLLWLLLLVVCWPLALLALVFYSVVWVLLLPFRLVGIAVEGVLRVPPFGHPASRAPAGRRARLTGEGVVPQAWSRRWVLNRCQSMPYFRTL